MDDNIKSVMNKVSNMTDLYYLVSILLEMIKLDNKDNKYGMIPELMYILGEEQFLKLIYYFEGQYIKVPTRNELLTILYLLIMFYNVEVLGNDFDEVRKDLKRGNSDRVPKYHTYKSFVSDLSEFKIPERPDQF